MARLAGAADKPAVAALFKPYREGLARIGGAEIGYYPYFDLYWTEAGRWPYLIEEEGRAIGLALVNTESLSGEPVDFTLAEFYIVPRHRRRGAGWRATQRLFVRHPGRWELAILKANVPATAYWPRAIALAGGLDLNVINRGDEWICRFRTAAAAERPLVQHP